MYHFPKIQILLSKFQKSTFYQVKKYQEKNIAQMQNLVHIYSIRKHMTDCLSLNSKDP